jgi:hypothetical protein
MEMELQFLYILWDLMENRPYLMDLNGKTKKFSDPMYIGDTDQ